MEKEINISTNDGQIIYGTLNWKKPKSKNLIIFVHGLTGNKNEHIFYNSARFFPKNGYDTYRFDFYGDYKDSRNLEDCTLKIHSKDLNHVINFFFKNYEELYLVGHSIAGPIISLSDLEYVKAIVLWDPSININKFQKELGIENLENTNYYILNWGMSILIGEKMLKEWNKFNNSTYVKSLIKPTLIICSKLNGCTNYKYWPKYIKNINSTYNYLEFDDADHVFNNEGTEKKLFEETLDWLNNN